MNEELTINGLGKLSLTVRRGCLVLIASKISKQIRFIPIAKILCVEVCEPRENHRGYIYFRTPVANRAIKPSVAGRDVAADDDMVFFDDNANYQAALKIQQHVADYFSKDV